MPFRADKRDFAVGDSIRGAGEFLAKNPPEQREVEAIFESHRPDASPSRLSSLYLFEDQECAMKYWCRLTLGKLYEVEIAPGRACHRGDMRLAEEAYLKRKQADAVVRLAQRYWSGEATSDPVMEVLVECAIVLRVLSKNEADRLAYFQHYGLGKTRPAFHWAKRS